MPLVGEYFKECYMFFSDFQTTVSREKKTKIFSIIFFYHSSNSAAPTKKIDNIVYSMQFHHKKFHQNRKGAFSAINKTLSVLTTVDRG